MRDKVGDEQLRAIGRQSQTSQTRIRRRAAGRLNGREKHILLQVKNVHVIDVRKINALPWLIVDKKFE